MTNAPVVRLFTETASGIASRCWYAGLLWALETLAWEPVRMPRVALILAALAQPHVKSTWANSPRESLLGIFRSWLPQTAASLDQRIAALDLLITKEEDVAFDLLCGLVDHGLQHATPAQRPDWRDDDIGAGHGVTRGEICRMIDAATERLFSCARGNPQRAARLIELARVPDTAGIKRALACAEEFAVPSTADGDKEAIRTVLRKKLHWHRKYDQGSPEAVAEILRPVDDLYERLLPKDLIVRHRWLFASGWCDLPTPKHEDFRDEAKELAKWREGAIRDIHAERGLLGVEQLVIACPGTDSIGCTLAALGLEIAELAQWIVERGGDLSPISPLTVTISSLICGLPIARSAELLEAVLKQAKESEWDANKIARFLLLAPIWRATWDFVTSRGADVERAYWADVKPMAGPNTDEADFEFVLDRLLTAGRPRSALAFCAFRTKNMDANRLTDILEHVLSGQEPDSTLLDSWQMMEAVQRLEACGVIDRDRLAKLEFGLFPVIPFEQKQCAATLYRAIMSVPTLFADLLYLIYKPARDNSEEPLPEALQARAKIARDVLHFCRCQPGTGPDGTIDRDAFLRFLFEARRLCSETDRLGVCDSMLGKILAHAPADADGMWPFEPAREVLDRPECTAMRHSFQIECRNKRGFTQRAIDEGGDQERELAETYRQYARAVCHSHPRLAAAMDQIASWYEQDGLREDREADLRRESY
jgi:hypothetical protein